MHASLTKLTNALSFYRSKIMILDHQIILVESKTFWSSPNYFGKVQIIKSSPEKFNLNLTKMIWTQPKRFGPDQNNLDSPK
jgi:hypothetical protein